MASSVNVILLHLLGTVQDYTSIWNLVVACLHHELNITFSARLSIQAPVTTGYMFTVKLIVQNLLK